MLRKFKNTLIIICIFVFTGCAQIQSIKDSMGNMVSNNRLKVYSTVQDKQLVDSIYELSEDGKISKVTDSVALNGYYFEELHATRIVIKKDMYRSGNMGEMSAAMRGYSYDSESDSLSKVYIEQAKNRGNTVKIYKPAFTKIVNGMFQQAFEPVQQSAQWYDKDVSLVEYDSSSRPVSILSRAHQARTSMGVNSYMYATIYFGSSNMRYFENAMPNSTFSEHILREIK